MALAVATSEPPPGDLTAAVAAALPAPGAAGAALESLRTKGILDGDGLTTHGRAVATLLRARLAERVARLVEGLDEADVAAVVRVLDAVRERAVALAATSR